MANPRHAEYWRLAGVAATGLTLGAILGAPGWGLALALALYLAYFLRNLARLQHWLSHSHSSDPPEASALWGEVFNHIYQLQSRNKRQKRKLASALSRFQQVATALPDATIILRESGEIEWCNDAAKRLLGLRTPQDIGNHITNLIRHPAFFHYLNHEDFSEPLDIPSPVDNDIALAIRVIPYGKSQRLILARDMTRIQRLEQTRRVFVANVSHELRTPLTVINGYLEALGDSDTPTPDTWRKPLQHMRQQALRMTRIVEELLSLSRLETKPPPGLEKAVAVPALLADLKEQAPILSGDKQHMLRFEIDNELWLKGAADELASAFSNLLSNAIRYTPAGGTITVRWYQDDRGAHFEVQDTGVGIAEEDIPRLTERFYRVDIARSRATGGTGLGLAIVKHVVNRHGGQLHIISKLGQGSTFTCHFPRQLIAHAPEKTAALS